MHNEIIMTPIKLRPVFIEMVPYLIKDDRYSPCRY